MNENWKPVVGYDGLYEVSDLGRARSLPRQTASGMRGGRVLRPGLDNYGYPKVDLYKVGRSRTRTVHRLVLEAFRGPCPDGMECCHGPDNDRANCRLDNLRWDTRKANSADKIKHGTLQSGERNGSAKLNATDIERIFDLRRCGCSQYAIADWIGTTQSNVHLILSGKKWAHLGLAA